MDKTIKSISKVILAIISVCCFACDSMDDIYTELDRNYDGYVTKFEYTLTDNDYETISNIALENAKTPEEQEAAKLIVTNKALVDGYSVQYIPYVLNEEYVGFGTNTVAKVSYNLSQKFGSVGIVTENYKMHFAHYWIFDPSEAYTMEKADYLLVSTYVKNNENLSVYWEEDFEGFDSYFGTKPKFSNFDFKFYNRQKNGDKEIKKLYDTDKYVELEELFFFRLEEALILFLQLKEGAQAVRESNGVEKLYSVTCTLYKEDGSQPEVTYTFRCAKEGATPEFEKVEGPIERKL